MTKKLLAALAVSALVTGGAFAQVQLSAGGGFVFDGGRTSGMSMDAVDVSAHETRLGFGGFAFLDATFAELSVGFMGGPMSYTATGLGVSYTEDGFSFTALDFTLLGRFPIAVGGGNITVAPLLGIGYNLVLGATYEGNDVFEGSDDSASDLSNFRILLGVGADFDINDNLFFRAQALGRYSFANSMTRDEVSGVDGLNATGGFGATIRLSVGFRF